MDDNIDVKPSDPYMSSGHEMNQSDLLTYDMSNQQVPGYQDDKDYNVDEVDDGLSHIHNRSSFIPSHTGKEQFTDSSLSDSNVGLGRDDGLLFDQSRDQYDFLDQGQTNPFQPDLLNMNPLSLESKNGHIRDNDLFEPNALSEMSSNQMEHNVDDPELQTPDLLMMESSPMHEKQEPKHSSDTDFKSCDEPEVQTQNELQNRQEAIENDFYNADDSMENYDDEYVDSEGSEYSDYTDENDEKETGLEQIVPELGEEQHTEIKAENVLTDNVDPNIGASGFSQKEEIFSKNVQFDENVEHLQVSDEENGNIDDTNNQDCFSKAEPGSDFLVGSVGSENATKTEPKSASEMESDIESEQHLGTVEKTIDDAPLEGEPTEPQGIPKSNTFTIESDSSDLEERSLTPDPNQLNNMETGPQFQNFAAGQSEDQGEIKDLIAGPLMEEDEESEDLDEDEVLDYDRNETEQQETNPFEGNIFPSNFSEQTSKNLGSIEMEQKETVSQETNPFEGSQIPSSMTENMSKNLGSIEMEQKETVSQQTNPFEGSQIPSNMTENTSENSGSIEMGQNETVSQQTNPFEGSQIRSTLTSIEKEQKDVHSEIFNDNVAMASDQSQVIIGQDASHVQLADNIQTETESEAFDENVSDNMDKDEINFEQQPSSDFSDMVTDNSDKDNKIYQDIYDDFDEFTKTGQIQNPEDVHMDTSKEKIETEEIDNSQQLTSQMSSAAEIGGLIDIVHSDNQTYKEDIKSDLDTGVCTSLEPNVSDISRTDPEMLGHGQTNSDSEEENYNEEIKTKESCMEGSIVLEEGETFDDQKFEQDIDETMSSEEDTETPNKGLGSDNFTQSSTDEINQEKIAPQLLDDLQTVPSSTVAGLDMASNYIQQDEKSQNRESDIDESYSSVEVKTEGQMEETGAKSSHDQDERVATEDKHIDDVDQEIEEFSPECTPEEIPSSQRESGMEGSFVLDQGETLDDKNFVDNGEEYVQSSPEISPEDEIPPNQRESGMEGSFVLEDGQAFEDKNFDNENDEFVQSTPEVSPEDELPLEPSRESGMEGSFVLEEGETFDNKQFNDNQEEFVQSTPEESPEDEIPANQMRESGMAGSFVLDDGETFDSKNFEDNGEEFVQSTPEVSPEDEIPANQMRESGMEGSFVLDEGETFDDKKFDDDGEEFVQSTPEVSPDDDNLPSQTRETGMEGSFVLDEGESFDDKKFGNNEEEFEQSTPEVSPGDEVPANQMRESGMEGSFVLEEGETFGDKKFSGHDEEFVQSTPEVSPEDEIPANQVKESTTEEQILNETIEKDVSYMEESIPSQGETASGGLLPAEEQIVDEGIGQDKLTIEQEIQLNENNQISEIAQQSELLAAEEKFGGEKVEAADEGQLQTPGDSYGEEGDVDSAIQSPLSQDEMIQSPSSDVNAAMYVEHENEKNLMSSSLVDESFGLNQGEAIETYQPCLQNGVSHSESEEVTPEKEASEPICYQNGISQSASDEFTPEKEAKMTSFNLVKDDQEKESISKLSDEKLELKDNNKVEVKKETKKTVTEIKKEVKETSKKTTVSTKPDRKKDATKETKKMSKDITQKKETHSKLPSPTKQKAEKRSVSASRITTPPSKTTPATRMPRDTTRKSRPQPTSTEPTKTIPTKQRPKSIDISRTSSLTRPTASSLNKSRAYEKTVTEGTPSPTKPLRSITKTAPSRYRITKSKKDASSDSGVEEDKSPRKTETQKKSEDGKVMRPTSAPKKSTIPTMNRTPVKSEASPTKSTVAKTTPTKTTPTSRTAQSKIGSLANSNHTPGGGQVKIQSQKMDLSNVSSKVGSTDLISHRPAGGHVKIENRQTKWKAESKIGSLQNAKHSPGGGAVKIQDKKLDLKDVKSKVGSKDKITHRPGGGDKKIETQKLNFKEKAQSKVGSKDNMDHKPAGGDKKIDTQKLSFKESAKPRTDTGVASGKSRPDSGIECEKTEASV